MDTEAQSEEKSLEQLMADQRHPDASSNVVSTLQPASCSKKLCILLKNLPLLLLVLTSLLVVQLPLVVYLVLLMPIYCLCRRCALKLALVKEAVTHEPEWLLPAADQVQVPPKLRGIIYMRGNPFIDDIMTFERAEWDADQRIARLHVYSPSRFSFQTSFIALAVCLGARLIRYRYEFYFDEDLKSCAIYPRVLCFTVPASLWSLNMTDVSKDQDGSLWERWTIKLGRPSPSYWAEKVVDAERQRTSYFEHVTSEVAKKCYVIA